MEFISYVLHAIRWSFALSGVFVICLGASYSLYHFFLGILGTHEEIKKYNLDFIRVELGRSIVLGLEFILAADVTLTIFTPDYYDLGILGILVVIRTILSYYLNKELSQLSPAQREKLR